MRTFKAEGIVIKRKNYREADRILTIFTKKNGKIRVKAKGVRKITSKRSPHIELLNYAEFNLHQGSGMPILTEVESVRDFSSIKKDLKKIGIAYHICELVDGLCAENQEHEDVFKLLMQALDMVAKDERLDLITYRFELKILRLLGFFQEGQNLPPQETQKFIESILERKLKTKEMLPKFS